MKGKEIAKNLLKTADVLSSERTYRLLRHTTEQEKEIIKRKLEEARHG